MIDISNLSKEELKALHKEISLKLSDEFNISKWDYLDSAKLRKLFNPEGKWSKANEPCLEADAVYNLEKAIISVCDLTTGLYSFKTRRCSGLNSGTVNKSFTREKYCPKSKAENYARLADGIVALVEKYYIPPDIMKDGDS